MKKTYMGKNWFRLPSPRFVVFYKGTDPQPVKQVLRLSDAFLKKQEQPELELLVTVYNINWGYNKELMKACHLLEEYAQYVDQVRQFASKMPFEEAVEKAVDYCIKNDILADFLSKNREEAIAVSIFELEKNRTKNLITISWKIFMLWVTRRIKYLQFPVRRDVNDNFMDFIF